MIIRRLPFVYVPLTIGEECSIKKHPRAVSNVAIAHWRWNRPISPRTPPISPSPLLFTYPLQLLSSISPHHSIFLFFPFHTILFHQLLYSPHFALSFPFLPRFLLINQKTKFPPRLLLPLPVPIFPKKIIQITFIFLAINPYHSQPWSIIIPPESHPHHHPSSVRFRPHQLCRHHPSNYLLALLPLSSNRSSSKNS